nr:MULTISPECIES: erythromycin esterase family protein [unclassified Mesorhizobium]
MGGAGNFLIFAAGSFATTIAISYGATSSPRTLIKRDDDLRDRLLERRLERFIGVIYRPETELRSHYAAASLSQQFDAFVWFDETVAVTPLGPEHMGAGVPDTYPFGL